MGRKEHAGELVAPHAYEYRTLLYVYTRGMSLYLLRIFCYVLRVPLPFFFLIYEPAERYMRDGVNTTIYI